MTSIYTEEAVIYSKHATVRMAQRGINRKTIDFILQYGNRCWAGDGCEEYAISERAVRNLDAFEYDKETISKASKVRLIINPEGSVVTCYFKYKNRSSRRISRRPVNRATCHK